jgi:hypothetical protein
MRSLEQVNIAGIEEQEAPDSYFARNSDALRAIGITDIKQDSVRGVPTVGYLGNQLSPRGVSIHLAIPINMQEETAKILKDFVESFQPDFTNSPEISTNFDSDRGVITVSMKYPTTLGVKGRFLEFRHATDTEKAFFSTINSIKQALDGITAR